ncbi:MAG: hypothetical protein QW491_14670, partial [Thermoproteota archaeon]
IKTLGLITFMCLLSTIGIETCTITAAYSSWVESYTRDRVPAYSNWWASAYIWSYIDLSAHKLVGDSGAGFGEPMPLNPPYSTVELPSETCDLINSGRRWARITCNVYKQGVGYIDYYCAYAYVTAWSPYYGGEYRHPASGGSYTVGALHV